MRHALSSMFVVAFLALPESADGAVACRVGEHANDAGACVACTPVANCAGGVTCTTAGDSTCPACDVGYFSQGGVPSVCAACGGSCPAGTYPSAACSDDADRVCSSCDGSCASCTGPSATNCTACAAGRYLAGGQCNTCSTCQPGTHESIACMATTDTVCVDDVPGPTDAGTDSGTVDEPNDAASPSPVDAGANDVPPDATTTTAEGSSSGSPKDPGVPTISYDAGKFSFGASPPLDDDCAVRSPGSAPWSPWAWVTGLATIALLWSRRRRR